jgi:signal transduction histidine kinase/ligand-binding sensor domain-containing protein
VSNRIRVLLFLLSASPCVAIDPQRAISQYVREHWGIAQGLPRGSIYSISQTPDGYLWIGAETGLLRYDGAVFKAIVDHTGTLPSTGVLEVLSDRHGDLWVRRRDSTLIVYRYRSLENAIADSPTNLTAMSRDRQGDLLVAWYQDGAFTVKDRKLTPVAGASGLPRTPVLALAQTADGSVWFGMRGSGLYRVAGGKTVRISIPGDPDPKVNSLLAERDGGLWIGTDSGLAHWTGKESDQLVAVAGLNGIQVLAMSRDRDRNLWLGTNSRGLIRLSSGGISFLDPDNYASTAITTVFEDREGSIWFGSINGIERLRDSPFVSFSDLEGLPTDGANPVYVDSGNRMWFPPVTGGLWWVKGHAHGIVHTAALEKDVIYSIAGRSGDVWLGRQRGGLTWLGVDGMEFRSKTFTTADGLAENSVYSVYASRDGTIWAGTLSGGVSHLVGGRFTTFTTADGLASNTIASILEDREGTIWLATPEGLSAYRNRRWKRYTTSDGLPANNVNCLFEDSGGALWAGTSSGLAMRKGDGFSTPPAVPPALGDSVLGIADDAFGALWITTASRVLSIPRRKLLDGSAAGAVREYGLNDGLRGTEGVKRHQSVIRDPFGRIWMSLNRGISMVDPARVAAASSAAAIVHIQGVSADGRILSSGEAFHVPPGSHRLEFEYAGLSLSIPNRVKYRYRVDSYDSAWSEPVSDRKAAYTNLAPGSYVFRVIASNPEGVWGSEEASAPFRVDPQVWQATWFQLCAGLLLVGASVAAYRWRMRLLTSRLNVRFEERIAERTRIGQELHDTLLQGFIGASMQLHLIADQMPKESPLKPPLQKVLALMRRVIDEGRDAVRGLRSSSDPSFDLSNALSRIPQDFPTSADTDFQVIVTGDQRPLRPLLRDEVFRIAYEAVVNAFRHANAGAIRVEIEYGSRRLRLLVRDDGRGIDPKTTQSGREGHWGLTGMRERAARVGASLEISSGVTSGTRVELTVPAAIAFQTDNNQQEKE